MKPLQLLSSGPAGLGAGAPANGAGKLAGARPAATFGRELAHALTSPVRPAGARARRTDQAESDAASSASSVTPVVPDDAHVAAQLATRRPAPLPGVDEASARAAGKPEQGRRAAVDRATSRPRPPAEHAVEQPVVPAPSQPRLDTAAPAAAPAEARAPLRPAPSVATPVPAPLPPTPAGVDVQGGVLRQAAHLRIDAGALGDLSLHLRVRGDTLHLRAEGEAASAIGAQRGELSRTLAGAGLSLGNVDLSTKDGALPSGSGFNPGGREQRQQGWDDAGERRQSPQPHTPLAPAPRAQRATAPATRRDGQVDVEA